VNEGKSEGKSKCESVSEGKSKAESEAESESEGKSVSRTCALDLNASTAESLERMSSTSVSSAPICRPQPIPSGTFNRSR
jgi:hypothetical protein